MFEPDFNPEKFVNAHKGMLEDNNGSTFRVMYYPPLEDHLQDTTRCGEHTDYGTFTLLAQDSEGGLEVTNHSSIYYLATGLVIKNINLFIFSCMCSF